MEQPQYNLLHRERVELEYAELYAELGLGTTVWSPLASGLLTGKYAEGVPPDSRLATPGYEWLRRTIENEPQRLARANRFVALARSLGEQPAALALAWCLKNPHVSTVILGATQPGQLAQNLGALDCLARLTPELQSRIEAAVA